MASKNTVTIPIPQVMPLGTQMTRDGVQEVWNTFVKPHQDSGEIQSIEMRMLMAILRSVYAGMDGK